MAESICNFMPNMEQGYDVRPVHFVFETEFHKMRQPFFSSIYYMHLVTSGTATLKTNDKRFPLKRGDIYFSFSGCLYEIDGSEDFEYMYISFMGAGALPLLEKCGIFPSMPVYALSEETVSFWFDSINRITSDNITLLTMGVLYYTLSFISGGKSHAEKKNNDLISRIVAYIDAHYRETELSLDDISAEFSYTGKYLSVLIKKNLHISFRRYLNNLRIQYAIGLMESGEVSVNKISAECGYSEPEYFSKVFRTMCDMSPTEYIRKLENQAHK